MKRKGGDYTQVGRITSLFGVLLPPKKKPIVSHCITVRFVLQGTVPSKKNRTRAASTLFAVLVRAATKPTIKEALEYVKEKTKLFIRSSPEHNAWVEASRPIILEQAATWSKKYARHGLVFPLQSASMKIYHYWADNQRRDNSNKQDTIADLLVNLGILSDDSWQCLNPISSESENYHEQILDHITTIDLTVRISTLSDT